MISSRLNNPSIYYQIILFLSFSISINYFVELKYVNLIFYIFFHITFIYICFYYFHYYLFFVAFIYGISFDLILINNIAPHLLTFLFLLVFISLLRKRLFYLKQNRISIIILLFLLIILFFEMFIASVFFNYSIQFDLISQFIIISLIIFLPAFYFFSKLDKL